MASDRRCRASPLAGGEGQLWPVGWCRGAWGCATGLIVTSGPMVYVRFAYACRAVGGRALGGDGRAPRTGSPTDTMRERIPMFASPGMRMREFSGWLQR